MLGGLRFFGRGRDFFQGLRFFGGLRYSGVMVIFREGGEIFLGNVEKGGDENFPDEWSN